MTDSGCDLISHERSDTPGLGLGAMLVLNIIDPKHDKGMDVKAALAEVSRRDESWVYHLRWARRPEL